jgi:surface antigen
MKSLIINIIGCILKSIHFSDKVHILKSMCKQTVLKSAEYFAKLYKYTKQNKFDFLSNYEKLKSKFTCANFLYFKNSLYRCFIAIIKLSTTQSNIKKELKLVIYFSLFIVITLTFSLWTSNSFKAFGMQNDNSKINSISQISKKVTTANINSDNQTFKSTLSEHISQVHEQLKANEQTTVNSSAISAPILNNTANVETPKTAQTTQTAKITKTQKSTKSLNTSLADYSNDPFKYPQCVWYVWARAKGASGIALQFSADFSRDAKNWLNLVKQTNGIQVVHDKNAIQPNSIAVFSVGGKGYGHVVYIENVVKSSNGKIKTVTISESNWGKSKSPSTKTLSWSEFITRSNGSLIGYINL